MRLFRASGQVHTHETDGFPVTDRADLLHACAVAAERNLELVPCHLLCLAVAQRHTAHFLLRDMLASHFHHIRTEDDLVLVVFLVFVEGVVLIDIFNIRNEGRSGTVAFGLLFRGGRVALRTVESFVALQNRHFLAVEIGTPVVVEIISRRVVPRREALALPTVPNVCGHAALQLRQVLAVSRPSLLLLAVQTVQTYVLHRTCARLVAEGYYRARRLRYVTPDGAIDAPLIRRRYRQTVLKRFLAVAQNIFAHVTEVEV